MPSQKRATSSSASEPSARDPLGVRGYLARDWGAARDGKRRYWQARMRRLGLAEALRVTEQLRAWTARNNPSWPTPEQREEDLETHRRVAQALAATARPVTRRSPGARTRRVR
jgi:hypothetical protein